MIQNSFVLTNAQCSLLAEHYELHYGFDFLLNIYYKKFSCTLAFLGLRQHDDFRNLLDEHRSLTSLDILLRGFPALVKVTVMRLTGAPSLPVPTYLYFRNCAHNCPGLLISFLEVANSLPPLTPLTPFPLPFPPFLRLLAIWVDLDCAC